jgi:DNA-binding transcriptional LysR family regulator
MGHEGLYAGLVAARLLGRDQLAIDHHVARPHGCSIHLSTGRVLPWLFAAPNRELLPGSQVRCAEDPHGGIALSKAGLGLFQTYRFLVEAEVARGELVEVLRGRSGRTRRFSLLYQKDSLRSRAVRAVTDFILERQ